MPVPDMHLWLIPTEFPSPHLLSKLPAVLEGARPMQAVLLPAAMQQ